ncbi:hypothetical protein KF728_09820 [Candidatus Obscuribacterales bacterium]|nr:hypothetical protein [Candidatus Obscuribacterales bacterium]
MNSNLHDIGDHMRQLGLAALQHANWHANYISHENAFWAELSALQAAHSAEILIKARIAEEHPLLIFEHLPKPPRDRVDGLAFSQLVERGRTLQFSDLPNRLWATTGMRLPNEGRYESFGRLRNTIQHFALPPDVDVAQETLHFIYEVIDPFINDCWNLYAIDFNEDHVQYEYLVANLIRRGVLFLVSPTFVGHYEFTRFDWPKENSNYREEMERRLEQALDQFEETPLK